jgi:hypothetical protein
VVGKDNIKDMFLDEFAKADKFCVIEHIFEDGLCVILGWKDRMWLRGCGFFQVEEGKILFQEDIGTNYHS